MILLFSVVVITATVLFSLSKMKTPGPVLPIEYSWMEIAASSLRFLAIPFGEAIILMSMAGDLENRVNPYKLFIGGSAISGVIVLAIYLHGASVLGQENMGAMYFPTYKAASIISIGSIGTRIEALVAYAFIVAGVTKAAAALAAGTRAIAAVFRIKDFLALSWPVGLFCLAMATFAFHNITEMFDHIDDIYPVYAIGFQLVVPFLIWVAAEVRLRGVRGA